MILSSNTFSTQFIYTVHTSPSCVLSNVFPSISRCYKIPPLPMPLFRTFCPSPTPPYGKPPFAPRSFTMAFYLRPTIVLIKRSWRRRVRHSHRHHQSHSDHRRPHIQNMDPDCAICSQPALAQCECEAKGLDLAVRQAEQRMMTSVFSEIRYITLLPPSSRLL